ncbi:MAG: hypothetical protein JWM47_3567 [Acidimicrobiales bacterium]|nr:hypothetical protein [Acidimicrobiales bacterium]
MLGHCQIYLDEPDRAVMNLSAAVVHLAVHGPPRRLGAESLELADLLLALGRGEEADACYRASAAAMDSAGRPLSAASAAVRRSVALEHLHRHADAIESIAEARSRLEAAEGISPSEAASMSKDLDLLETRIPARPPSPTNERPVP